MAEEAATEWMSLRAEAGITDMAANSTTNAMADIASARASSMTALADTRAAATDLFSPSIRGGTSSVESRTFSAAPDVKPVAPTTNYNSGPPTTWAGAAKGIIVGTGVVVGGGVGLGYSIFTAEQGKQVAKDTWNGIKELGKDLTHGVEDGLENAAHGVDHLTQAASKAAGDTGAFLGGPVKTIAEIGVSVVVGVGVLYVSYRGYMFLKG